jgi:hypothetical protein
MQPVMPKTRPRVVLAVAQELAGAPVDAFLGLLAHGAGVEEDDVGGGGDPSTRL